MSFATGHLQAHPLPPGIVGALSLSGYQLLADVAGVGAGRLGTQAFLLVAPEPDNGLPDIGTQIVLHQPRLRDEAQAAAYVQLAAQLGYLRLSGYRLALERSGLRSKLSIVNPATGAIVMQLPQKHPGGLFGGGNRSGAVGLLADARALPPAGPPPDLRNAEFLRQTLLALALTDDTLEASQAVEVAERAVTLAQADATLDPAAALAAAKRS